MSFFACFVFKERSIILIFVHFFFYKEGEQSHELDVICKGKGDVLLRATYKKSFLTGQNFATLERCKRFLLFM